MEDLYKTEAKTPPKATSRLELHRARSGRIIMRPYKNLQTYTWLPYAACPLRTVVIYYPYMTASPESGVLSSGPAKGSIVPSPEPSAEPVGWTVASAVLTCFQFSMFLLGNWETYAGTTTQNHGQGSYSYMPCWALFTIGRANSYLHHPVWQPPARCREAESWSAPSSCEE